MKNYTILQPYNKLINTVNKNGESNIIDEDLISPLTQQLFASILKLIQNTVNYKGNPIWNLDNSIFMIPFNNNIIPPQDSLYMLIHQQDIRALTHQNSPIVNYQDNTMKRYGEFTVDVQIDVYSPTQKPYGLALQENWVYVFNQDIIAKWIQPFMLLNTTQRIKSMKPISLEIDNGMFIIHNKFTFTLMYSLESIANFIPYGTIDTNLQQINRGV